MAIKLRLVGCDRFNFRGELYEKGKVYRVGDDKGKIMLRKQDEYDRPYFAEYQAPPEKSAAVLAKEAAEAAALAAAELAAKENRVEEVVDRPDGSEPDKVVAEDLDPDAPSEPEEVDLDDDPDLDEDTAGSDEEVSEDVDRADGSEVQV